MLDFAFDAGNYEIIPAGGPDRTSISTGCKVRPARADGHAHAGWLSLRPSRIPRLDRAGVLTDDQTYDSAGVTRTAPGGGVILTQTKFLPDAKYIYDSNLIDFHTTTSDTVIQRHPGLRDRRESFTAPLGIFFEGGRGRPVTRVQVTLLPSLDRSPAGRADRYDALRRDLGQDLRPGVTTAYSRLGEIYTDALSGAPVADDAARSQLTARDAARPRRLPPSWKRLRPGRIVILGGPNTITENVAAAAASATGASIERWSGKDRFLRLGRDLGDVPLSRGRHGIRRQRAASDALRRAPVAGRDKNPDAAGGHQSHPAVRSLRLN